MFLVHLVNGASNINLLVHLRLRLLLLLMRCSHICLGSWHWIPLSRLMVNISLHGDLWVDLLLWWRLATTNGLLALEYYRMMVISWA